jgi:hypothetical protein
MAKKRNSRAKSKSVANVVAPIVETSVAVVEPVMAIEPEVVTMPVEPAAVMPVTEVASLVSVANVVPEQVPTHAQIARRAFELWLRRGAPNGTHLDDWLSAERELRVRAA